MTKIFELNVTKPGAELSISPPKHLDNRFMLALSGHGFDAYRYVNRADLTDLRDWINKALDEGE